ncbi:enoyl-CoA hydratase-related protein [Gephyromycinifex aptenodytis]|uniref:enoyl-CoA hydratase-related protein n=1 Tax=Gephyromycinifex aptenodytis TaxID=2716227 RepID=UPI0014479589|nr:enoyl-CoA hydratase-related protein [Gephyromycinifex aptenodytis]
MKPTTDELLVHRREGVVEITFNRPHRHNAFTTAMYIGLLELFAQLDQDPDTRVLVLRGAGSVAFAAGNDISEFAGMTSGAQAVEYEARVRKMLDALLRLPQVSIAAVDGLCVGGGLGVATYCDLRLVTGASRFGYPIARTLGNALSRPLLERCVHIFGEALTREMLLASRLIDAERAYAVGAVLPVCPTAEQLERELEALIEGVLQAAPMTLRATKQQLLAITESGVDPSTDERLLEHVYSSAGFREGVRAFLAKEKPRFGEVDKNERA